MNRIVTKGFASAADVKAIEDEMPWAARDMPRTMYEFLSRTAKSHGARPAISYQIFSGPTDKAITLMLAQPSMIKRPVLEADGNLLIGFKPDLYEAVLANA